MTNNLEIADSKTITNRIKGLKNLLAVLPMKGRLENSGKKLLIKFGNSAYTAADTIVLPLALMMQKNYDRSEVIALLAHELGHQFFTPDMDLDHSSSVRTEIDSILGTFKKTEGAHDFRNVVEDLRVDFLSNETIPNSKLLCEYQLIKTISDKAYLESVKNTDNVNLVGLAFIYEGYNLIFNDRELGPIIKGLKTELINRAKLLHIPSELTDLESDYEEIVDHLKKMLGCIKDAVDKNFKRQLKSVNTTIYETKKIIAFYDKYFVVNENNSVPQGTGEQQDQSQQGDSSGENNDSDNQDQKTEDDSSNEDTSKQSDNSSDEDNSDNTAGSSGEQGNSNSDKNHGSSDSESDSDNDDLGDSAEQKDLSSGEDNSATQNSDSDGKSVKATCDIKSQILEKLFEQSEEILSNRDDLSQLHQNIIDALSTGFDYVGEEEYTSDNNDGTLTFDLLKSDDKGNLKVSDRNAINKLYSEAEKEIEEHPDNLHDEKYWEQLENKAFRDNISLLGKLKQALNAYKPKYFTSPCKSGFKLNKAQIHNIASGQHVNKPFSRKEKGIDLSTEIVFLTDVSGSMQGERANRVNETMLVLCDALKKVGNNLKVTIGAYDTYVYSVKKSSEPFSMLKTKMPHPYGYTRGEKAMLWALKCLRHSKANRRIIICLTDGEWDTVKSKEHYDLIRKAGIETYGLGYMTISQIQNLIDNSKLPHFDRWFVVGDDLKEFYLKFLTELLTIAPH